MTRKLPTGMEVLDRKLDGGIPAGSVVVLSAPPVSQSELFLYELASVRESLYLTTEREAAVVEDVLTETGVAMDGVDVRRVEPDRSVAQAGREIDDLPDGGNLIVDPVRTLERSRRDPYRAFLNALSERVAATGGIAFLHALDGRTVPERRDLTEYMADIVFDLSTEVTGDTLESRLTIPKFRGGQALEEVIKLNLTAEVAVDVSRKIA